MFALLIAFCSVSVGCVVAELWSSVRALMVFARSMQFSDNIFEVNLHIEKKYACRPKLQCKNAKEGRLLSVQ